jgi:uncharacterized iron-regulated membrane protein
MKNFWAVVILFLLWFLSMYFYMPLALVLILFAALVSGASVTICSAWMRRRTGRTGSVIKQDTKT